MKIQTSVRVEDEFYKEATKVFKRFGLTFGDAVNLFLSKVSMEQAIPFALSIPQLKQAKNLEDDFIQLQESSMKKSWDNEKDKAWDEL